MITEAIQRNLGLRLTIEEFLKILAHIIFQTNTELHRVSTLNWSQLLSDFCISF